MPKPTTRPEPLDEAQPSPAPRPDISPADVHQRIAQRAYERYQTRDAEPGLDQEDWFEAERELKETE